MATPSSGHGTQDGTVKMKSTASSLLIEQELREMNEALLISSVHQHELAEKAHNAETALLESEHRLAAELAATRALHDISTQLIQEGDIKSLYEHVLDAAVAIMRSDFASIQMYEPDDSGGELCLLGFRGFDAEAAQFWKHVRPSSASTCGVALRTGRRCVVADVEKCDFMAGSDDLKMYLETGIRAVQSTPLFSRSGHLLGMISTHWRTPHTPLESDLRHFDILARQASDLIERKLAEDVTARLASIVEFSDDAIISKDLDGVITSWNRGAQHIFGYTADEVIGKSVLLLIPEDHLEEEPRILSRIRKGESVEHFDTVRRRKDGRLLDISLTVSPIKNGLGQIIGASKVARDITERKKADQALLESEQRFRQVADEAAAANRAKDMFLATLSHEMRTPLSAIVGWMSLLEGGTEGSCTDAELNEGLDVVKRNARAMVELLDDVMDVSRIVSGKLRLEVRPNELSAIIGAGIDVVRSAADAKDIAISTDLDPAASGSTCDAARMQQVIWNLLSNAIKFTPKGGKIHVTLTRDQSDARIQISDSGPGISPELLPYVFDRFRQADSSTRRKFGGLGLGLSIVKQLVELHGGTVEADSPGEGLGSTFTVNLPISAVSLEESGDELEAQDGQQSATAGIQSIRLDGLRVLVVDDEPDARRLLTMVLEQAGAVVTEASSVADALAALPTVNPEILISDLGMPDMDGFDLVRRIRAHGYHARDLPAVALSAFIRKEDQREALLAGFQVHLSKPVDPRDLTAVIASLAGRTGANT